MIVQVFRIHIINDIVSKPRVDTTMNRNENLFDACTAFILFSYM